MLSSRLRELALFCHKMENALHAGFDLERALIVMLDEEKGPLKGALERTLKEVECGRQLNTAMRKDESIYTPELVNTVYITEKTGHIEQAFGRMAQHFDRQQTTKRKIRQAALYPVIVLVVFIAALFAVTAYYKKLSVAVTVTAVIVAFIAAFFFLRYGGSALGRTNLIAGNVLIHVPLIGKMIMKSELADFADNMATFYFCGEAVESGLKYSARSIRNSALRDKVLKAAAYVAKGNPLSEALMALQIFPSDLVSSVRIGEESGNVDGMLEKIASYYRKEVQDRVDILFAIIRQ